MVDFKKYIVNIIDNRNFQHGAFLLRFRYFIRVMTWFRILKYRIMGMGIGKNTMLPKFFVTWPHQLSIGANCRLEHHIYFKYDGIWSKGPSIRISDDVFIGANCEFNINTGITIGENTLIASGCRFIDHNHGTSASELIRKQQCTAGKINIDKDVWLGCNVVVLQNVDIGEGAIVGAGSVVTKSIPPYEIWGGIPARKIGERRSVCG